MNTLVLFLTLTGFTLCLTDQYTDRYDDINIEEILQNRRLLVPYVKCVLGEGRCTPEGKVLKQHIKDGMQTGCEKCTEKQRIKARQVVKHIREKEAEYWQQIKSKFDPQDEYKEIYESFLQANN